MLAAESPFVADLRPSPCFEPRRPGLTANMLILHYTGMMSCARAIDWLSREESRVSCHYVIDVDGRITQMVSEQHRAWHAGHAAWKGECDVNSMSIGFEIHNPGHDYGYPDFPDCQMRAVTDLARDVVNRWAIPPERVLAHSDVAPHRKNDPGEKFDWRRLADGGVGLWVEPAPIDAADDPSACGADPDIVAHAQRLLMAFGYELEPTGRMDERTQLVVIAFQRHFRPARVDGILDRSTTATLERVVAAVPSALLA